LSQTNTVQNSAVDCISIMISVSTHSLSHAFFCIMFSGTSRTLFPHSGSVF